MPDGGYVSGTPRLLLRLEGAAVLAAALWLYHGQTYGWWLFAVLILAPDLSALGYLAGRRAGTTCYNAAHNYVLPILLALWGVGAGQELAVALALIWAAHIGADRMLGYGLKYASGFSVTHLGLIGKARQGLPEHGAR
jgi:hypothetical protein